MECILNWIVQVLSFNDETTVMPREEIPCKPLRVQPCEPNVSRPSPQQDRCPQGEKKEYETSLCQEANLKNQHQQTAVKQLQDKMIYLSGVPGKGCCQPVLPICCICTKHSQSRMDSLDEIRKDIIELKKMLLLRKESNEKLDTVLCSAEKDIKKSSLELKGPCHACRGLQKEEKHEFYLDEFVLETDSKTGRIIPITSNDVLSLQRETENLMQENEKLSKKVQDFEVRLKEMAVNKTSSCECTNEEIPPLKEQKDSITSVAKKANVSVSDIEKEIRNVILSNHSLGRQENAIETAVEIQDSLCNEIADLVESVKKGNKNTELILENLKDDSEMKDLINAVHKSINSLCSDMCYTQEQLKQTECEMSCLRKSNEEIKAMLYDVNSANNYLKNCCAHYGVKNKTVNGKMTEINPENFPAKEPYSTIAESTVSSLNEEKIAVMDTTSSDTDKTVDNRTQKQTAIRAEAKEGIEKLTNVLIMYETRCTELADANKVLQNELNAFKSRPQTEGMYSNMQTMYYNLEKKYLQELSEKCCLAQEIAIIKAEMETVKSYVNNFQGDKEDNHKSLKDAESKIHNLECRNFQLIQETEEHKYAKNEMESKVQYLENQLNEKGIQNHQLLMLHEEKQEIINSLQHICANKDACITALKDDYNNISLLYEKGEQQIITLKEQVIQLEANLQAIQCNNEKETSLLTQEKKMLENCLKEAREDIKDFKIKFEEQNNKILRQKNNIGHLQVPVIEYDRMKHQLEAQEEMFKDYENLKLQRNKLIQNQQELLTEIKNLHQNLKKKQKKCESLTKFCSSQGMQIKELGNQLQSLEKLSNASTICSNCKEIKKCLDEANAKLQSFENQIAVLEQELAKHKIETDVKEIKVKESKFKDNGEMYLESTSEIGSLTDDDDLLTLPNSLRAEKELLGLLTKEVKKRHAAEAALKTALEQQLTLSQEIKPMQANINDLKEKLKQAQEEYHMQQKNSSKRENELITVIEEKMAELYSKNGELRAALKEKELLTMNIHIVQNAIAHVVDHNKLLEKQIARHEKTLSEIEDAAGKSRPLEYDIHYFTLEANKVGEAKTSLEEKLLDVTVTLSKTQNKLKEVKMAPDMPENVSKGKADVLQVMKNCERTHSVEKEQSLQEIKCTESDKTKFAHAALEINKVKDLLEKEHENLTQKLIQAMQFILEERSKYEKAECQIQDLNIAICNLKEERVKKEEELQHLKEEMQHLKERNNMMKLENLSLQEKAKQLGDSHPEQSSALELLIEGLNEKLLITERNNQKEMEKMEDLILIKEATIMENKKQLSSFEEKFERLTKVLNETREKLLKQREEHGELEKEIINLQAEKRQLNVRLQGLEGHLQEEMQLRQQLQNSSQNVLDGFLGQDCPRALSTEELKQAASYSNLFKSSM